MIVNLGDAPFKAFITVTYPKGTCTVSDGTTRLSHSGGGTYTFTVKKKGTWTVTAQYSTAVKTASVDITYRGQVESVTLSYTLLLYDKGTNYTDVTGGWESRAIAYSADFNKPVKPTISYKSDYMRIVQGDDSYYQNGIVSTKKKIDLTPYVRVKIELKAITTTHDGAGMYLQIHDSFGTYRTSGMIVSTSKIKTSGTYTRSLVDVNQTAYIAIDAYWGITIDIAKIWLEV